MFLRFQRHRRTSVLIASLTAAALLGGCSHHNFEMAGERFPAPAQVVHQAKPKPRIHKANVNPQPVASPKLIARRTSTEDAASDVAATARPENAPKTSNSQAPEAPLAAAQERPTSAGRRAAQDAPAPKARLQPSAQLPSIGAIIEQAELNLRIGNVTAARAVLEPLVAAKHPEALAEMGKTYDPIELEKFLVPPGTADITKAIALYSESARLGSLVGKIRLDRLTAAPVSVEKQR